MLDKIIALLKYSKLPTILLVAVLLSFSAYLIKGEGGISPSSIFGSTIGLIAILFSIFSYADYRAREHIDHIISKYETALNNISATLSRYGRDERSTISGSKERQIGSSQKGKGYSIGDGFDGDETADGISDL